MRTLTYLGKGDDARIGVCREAPDGPAPPGPDEGRCCCLFGPGCEVDQPLCGALRDPSEGGRVTLPGVADRRPGCAPGGCRALQALLNPKEHHRILIERPRNLIVVVNAEGKILYTSPPVEQTFGYTTADLRGSDLLSFVHPEEVEGVREGFRRTILEAELPRRRQIRIRTKEGAWRLLDGTARYVESPLLGSVIIIHVQDITDRRQLEDQCRQAQKMEAIGRLSGGIAHDFNNLLMGMIGYLDLALPRLEADHPARPLIQQVRRASDRAASLTRQLLAFSRQQVMAPAVLDLRELVRGLEDLLRRLIGEHIELVLDLPEEPAWVEVDRAQMEQVVMNLAVNARDAMPQGGRLTLRARGLHRPLRAYGALSDAWMTLAVSDTGQGMDPETLSRIFEPFFTTKEPGKGTGLGLSMVYGTIQQSGGEITAASRPGKGTTFRIFLPKAEPPQAGSPETRPAEEKAGAPRHGGTLLLVEDEDMVRDVLRQALERAGYRVLEAPNRDAAWRLCCEHPSPIDLMVSDLVMPGMSAEELRDRLAGRRPEMKVLYMSGYAAGDLVGPSALGPSADLIQKPFTLQAALARIRAILAGP